MRLMHTSLEVRLMKRELKHKILEACMFLVSQSHERRPNKSNELESLLMGFLGQEESNSIGHSGTTRVGEQASDNLSELDSVSRSTFQWSRTSPGEPSGRFHGKQRPQRSSSTPRRSPSASRHSGNIENPSHKSPGLPGPTVFGRRRRANDPTRGKRVTEANIKMHKGQSETGDAQLHSECPNRAKPTLGAPSDPNIRSRDV
ncbi:hypothetical protein CRG98_003631 [Punica granatum]|uniref:Uncharacterized protein n=1 Tax=Punica granatum TaxID=22663 RepID=A0A2I0L5T5_PUNGR|nr:hypothetical protein CRG98_003631 [Punica granatum]